MLLSKVSLFSLEKKMAGGWRSLFGWNRKRKNEDRSDRIFAGSSRQEPSGGVKSGVIEIKSKDLAANPPKSNDKRWKEVGTVDRLYIHPLKSGRGLSVKDARIEKYGLRNGYNRDRQFIIVDRKNYFVSARRYWKIVLIQTEVANGQVIFEAPRMGKMTVDLPKKSESKSIHTSIFFQDCEGLDLGKECSEWISKYINNPKFEPFRILYHPYDPKKNPENKRVNSLAFDRVMVPNSKKEDTALFADHYAFTMMMSRSIDELNNRLKDRHVDLQVEQRRFRPNIFVKNHGEPFEEDNWIFVKVGETVFRMARYSTRCVFTCIDPDTGVKNKQFEPLKTLKSFRSSLDSREKRIFGSSPFFGINLGLEGETGRKIHLDDKVYAIANV